MYDEFLHVQPEQMRAAVVRAEYLAAENDRLRKALQRVQRWLGDAGDSRTADDMDALIADALETDSPTPASAGTGRRDA